MKYKIKWTKPSGEKGIGKISFDSLLDAKLWCKKLSDAWIQNVYVVIESE